MDNIKGKIPKNKLAVNMQYDEAQTMPLALHEMHMARADRRLKWVCICWAASLIAAIALFVFLWLQYDYSSSSSVETSGVYNLVDSEGNVLTSDISPDDVIRILETLNNGESKGNANTDTNP